MEIIKTSMKLEVGKIYGDNPNATITNHEGEPVRCPRFQVLKIATEDDYYDYLKEHHNMERHQVPLHWLEDKNYYFISMD